MVVDPSTGVAQRCFVGDDGFRRCNFVIRNGIARWTKSGKYWTFPAFPFGKVFRRKKDDVEIPEVGVTKTATTSEK